MFTSVDGHILLLLAHCYLFWCIMFTICYCPLTLELVFMCVLVCRAQDTDTWESGQLTVVFELSGLAYNEPGCVGEQIGICVLLPGQ